MNNIFRDRFGLDSVSKLKMANLLNEMLHNQVAPSTVIFSTHRDTQHILVYNHHDENEYYRFTDNPDPEVQLASWAEADYTQIAEAFADHGFCSANDWAHCVVAYAFYKWYGLVAFFNTPLECYFIGILQKTLITRLPQNIKSRQLDALARDRQAVLEEVVEKLTEYRRGILKAQKKEERSA